MGKTVRHQRLWERQLKVPEVVGETAYGTRGCGKGSLKYQRLWERQFKVPEVVGKTG